MKTIAAPLLALAAALSLACAGSPEDPTEQGDPPIGAELWSIVTGADALTIRRIHPVDARYMKSSGDELPSDVVFHGYPELGSTELTDPATITDLLDSLRAGIEGNDDTVAACFNPRHGLTAELDGRRVDLLICFECLQIQIHDETGENVEDALTTEAPAAVFNRVFAEAGI